MFGNFMDKLYPVKDLLTNLTQILHLKPENYDLDNLINTMKQKEQIEILNSEIDEQYFNNKILNKFNFILNSLKIGRLFLLFKKSYMKDDTILKFENITIDIKKNINENNNNNNDSNNNNNLNEENKKEKKENFDLGFLGKIINTAIKHIIIEINNVKLRILDENNKILFTLMLNNLMYKDSKNPTEIEKNKLLSYIFLHNKCLYLNKFMIKENYNEDYDKIFFNENSENNVNFFTDCSTILFMNQEISLDFNHNINDNNLIIENKKENIISIESIIYKRQIKKIFSLIDMFKIKKNNNKNIENKNNENNNKNNENKNENKNEKDENINLLGFKIKKFIININIQNIYFVITDDNKNNEEIPKFFMIYQKYFKKYYDIFSDKNNQNKFYQTHFCYLSNSFYLLFISNNILGFNIEQSKIKFKYFFDNLNYKLIEPNKIENKRNTIIINNTYSKDKIDLNNPEQVFNEMFLNYYLNIVKYSFFSHDIFNIYKFNLLDKQILFESLYLDINALVLNKKFNYIKDVCGMNEEKKEEKNVNNNNDENNLININEINIKNNENNNNNININENKINNNNNNENNNNNNNNNINELKEDEKNNFEILGTIYIKILTNKKCLKYINNTNKEKYKEIDNEYFSEFFLINIVGFYIKINSSSFNFDYQKLLIWYFMNSLYYPFLINYQNNEILLNQFKQINNNLLIIKNEKININLSKFYFYFNPILFKYLKIYVQILLNSFKIFNKKKNNNNNENNNNNNENKNFNNENKNLINKIKNINLIINEINFIIFSSLNIKKNRIDLKKFANRNELIFKFILNPFFNLKIINFYFNNFQFEIDNIIFLIKKKDNSFQNEIISYQNFIIDDSFKFFEILLKKSLSNKKILSAKINENLNNFNINFNDFFLCLISINNEIIDINKFFNNKNNNNNNNNNKNNNNKNLIFEINFNQIIIDIFSIYKKEEINLLNPLKNKMRFLTFLSKISIKIKENSFDLNISNLSSFLLKGLDLNPFVTLNLSDNLTNKNTLINFLGFSHILTINSLKINLSNKKTQILLNLNTNSIEFYFCIDSLKFFNELIIKIIEDVFNMNFHVKILEDDNETIITETEIQREKINEFEQNGIEYRSVGRAYSDNDNLYSRIIKMVKNPSLNSKEKKEIKDENVNNNNKFINDFELISFGFFIEKIKIFFFDGEDFHFQTKFNFNYDENFNFNDENKIIKINQRNFNENVNFNFYELNFLFNNFKNSEKFLSITFILKSLIIELQKSFFKHKF